MTVKTTKPRRSVGGLVFAYLSGIGSAILSFGLAVVYDELKTPSETQQAGKEAAESLEGRIVSYRELFDGLRLSADATDTAMQIGETVSVVRSKSSTLNQVWSNYQSNYYDLKNYSSNSPEINVQLEPVRVALYNAVAGGAAIHACIGQAVNAYTYGAVETMIAANRLEAAIPSMPCRDEQRPVFLLRDELGDFDRCNTSIKIVLSQIVLNARRESDDSPMAQLRRAVRGLNGKVTGENSDDKALDAAQVQMTEVCAELGKHRGADARRQTMPWEDEDVVTAVRADRSVSLPAPVIDTSIPYSPPSPPGYTRAQPLPPPSTNTPPISANASPAQ